MCLMADSKPEVILSVFLLSVFLRVLLIRRSCGQRSYVGDRSRFYLDRGQRIRLNRRLLHRLRREIGGTRRYLNRTSAGGSIGRRRRDGNRRRRGVGLMQRSGGRHWGRPAGIDIREGGANPGFDGVFVARIACGSARVSRRRLTRSSGRSGRRRRPHWRSRGAGIRSRSVALFSGIGRSLPGRLGARACGRSFGRSAGRRSELDGGRRRRGREQIAAEVRDQIAADRGGDAGGDHLDELDGETREVGTLVRHGHPQERLQE